MATTPRIVSVEVTESRGGMERGWNVSPIWADVDRPNVGGYGVGPNRKLAERLKRAIEAGVVYYDAQVKVDVNGATYVQANSRVLGRIMNADLKRLGF